ncbi:MAG TPA: efflux transporter outer membrane subunit [Gemmatimonadales bacterium]|nr:efflux transporter outer membrane subunit [Gemmatimonadales bacterium]
MRKALLLAVLLGGGPAYAPAQQAPETIVLDFWRRLSDTTLSRLMEEALQANHDIRLVEARVRGARAFRLAAGLDLAPTVTFAGGYTRQRPPRSLATSGPDVFPGQDVWDGGVDASWELDLFGRLRNGFKAQGGFVAAAREDLRDVQVVLLADLAAAYFDLRGTQEQLAVARRNGANQGRTLELTRQRLEAGRGTAFDTERAQAQLSFTLATIPGLEARVASAQHQIGVLIGRSPAAVAGELRAAAPLPALPDTVTLPDADSAVRYRPDVAAAERRLEAERSLVRSARADYLPRVTLAGSAGFAATALDSLGERGSFRYAVGPVVTWPLLNLGRVKAGVDVSRARRDEAQARYQLAVLQAQQEIASAVIRYRSAQARVVQIEAAAVASERAAELARLRFSEGAADFLQVLDAERTQLEAQDQLARARTDAATAYAGLYRALGR